jgi:hypothetical protein
MAKTRFGIFGCGYIGRTRAEAAAHLDSAWEVMLETVKRLGAPLFLEEQIQRRTGGKEYGRVKAISQHRTD